MPTDDLTTSPGLIAEKKARRAAEYQARKEKTLATSRAWYHANKEKAIAYSKARYAANKELILARGKKYREQNREAILRRKAAYRKANPPPNGDKQRANGRACWYRRKYGLSKEGLTELIAACGGRCPCCKTPFSDMYGERPCVDHCHQLGNTKEAIRGILCHRCNLVLGHACDSPKILRALARHLEAFQKQREADAIKGTTG